MTEDRPDATVTAVVDDGPVHAIKAFLAAVLSEILGYLIAIPALIAGFVIGMWVLDLGLFNSWVLSFAISIGLGWLFNKLFPMSEDQIRTGFFKIPTVSDTRRRRGRWQESMASSDRAESGLRQRLIEMGVRSKDDPPAKSRDEAFTPPRDPDDTP
jgi:hypothetical protein